jgi:two-component system, OmpR family, sensor histidine kinase KdpD
VLLASVSHDFRTPLASILGAATSLSEFGERFTPERRDDLLVSIREEAERLDAMVRNLLAITRLEAGALDIRRDWVDVGDIVERVAGLARRRGARQTIAVEIADEPPLVRADAILIEQALSNVLGNAVLHCPAETAVTLGLRATETALEISVTDDGPGVPADIRPHVFDKFVSGDRRQGDGGIGHGLGLAIARGILEAHGGSIRVESPVAAGRGTRFVLVLPREGETG